MPVLKANSRVLTNAEVDVTTVAGESLEPPWKGQSIAFRDPLGQTDVFPRPIELATGGGDRGEFLEVFHPFLRYGHRSTSLPRPGCSRDIARSGGIAAVPPELLVAGKPGELVRGREFDPYGFIEVHFLGMIVHALDDIAVI